MEKYLAAFEAKHAIAMLKIPDFSLGVIHREHGDRHPT